MEGGGGWCRPRPNRAKLLPRATIKHICEAFFYMAGMLLPQTQATLVSWVYYRQFRKIELSRFDIPRYRLSMNRNIELRYIVLNAFYPQSPGLSIILTLILNELLRHVEYRNSIEMTSRLSISYGSRLSFIDTISTSILLYRYRIDCDSRSILLTRLLPVCHIDSNLRWRWWWWWWRRK